MTAACPRFARCLLWHLERAVLEHGEPLPAVMLPRPGGLLSGARVRAAFAAAKRRGDVWQVLGRYMTRREASRALGIQF